MKRSTRYIDILLRFLLPIYILTIILLTVFRLIFIYHQYDDIVQLYPSSNEIYSILKVAMGKGFRFDNIVTSTTFILPLALLIIFWITNLSPRVYLKFVMGYLIIASAIIFGFSCIDFPYYKYFGIHPNKSISNWLTHNSTYKMIFEESSYYLYFLLYIITITIVIFFMRFCYRKLKKHTEKRNSPLNKLWVQICLFLLFIIFIRIGYRGHTKHPINRWNATFTMFSFINDIPLTPIYNFAVSLRTAEVGQQYLADSDSALTYVKNELKLETNSIYKNPLTREIKTDTLRNAITPNIVLIFMESMSVDLLGKEENNLRLTPFLDSLIDNSYYFENFYSSGTHTNNGVGAVVTGYPSLFELHMMKPPHLYKGIASTLKEIGYQSSFFIPHDEEYDYMGDFLRACDFDRVYDRKDYNETTTEVWGGVPDDILFHHSLNYINSFSDKPFLSMIMTVSNHPPFIAPEKYKNISDDPETAVLAYVDEALRNFIHGASEQDWYDNTIFILVGDHGKKSQNYKYNMDLSYNHVPCIIFSRLFKDMPRRLSQVGGQIDTYPTIMGLINQPYKNNSLGIDLLNETRPYIYFTSDARMGCINDSLFYVFDPMSKDEQLYDLQNGVNVIDSLRSKADTMKKYGTSMLSVSRDLYIQGLTNQY